MKGCWIVLALLSISGTSVASTRPHPPPPPPKPVDINSPEFRKQFAREQAAALRKASRSRSVTRAFIIGWEMHQGYFLIPAADPEKLVIPDFPDDRVRRQFDDLSGPRIYPAGTEIPHLGQKLVCQCKGVEWRFYGQSRFIVRSAKLDWQ